MSVRHTLAVGALAALAATAVAGAPPAMAATTATVVGTVTGPSGEPLAGLSVGGPGLGGGTDVTTAQGRYRITGVALGATVTPCAVPPADYQGGTAAAGYLGGCGSGTTSATRTTRVDVHLPLGAGMSGRIVDDRTGGPIAGATVLTLSEHDSPGIGPQVTTAADGTWSARGLQPGQSPWFVCVNAVSGSADAPFGYGGLARERCSRWVDLTAGSVATGLSVRLPPSARISGKVTGPGDLGNVAVSAGTARASLGQGGAYVVEPAAHYGSGPVDGTVCAQGQGSYSRPRGYAIRCGTAAYSVSTPSRLDLTVSVGAALRGTITGATTATTVWVVWQGRRLPGFVLDSTGRYSVGGLPTGTYVVHAAVRSGAPAQSARVRVVQGSVVDGVDFTLT